MASPSHMGSNATTLKIEERVLARCEEGALQAEYALFMPRDARGGDARGGSSDAPPGDTRYETTAGEARARLESAGVNLALAEEAAAALKPDVVDAYALADCVKSVAARLGPGELFEGKTYDAPAQVYDGAWLDMRALARDLNVPGAGLALQALHLAAMISECDPEARVVLSIDQSAAQNRSERAFHRVPSDYVRRLLGALRALQPSERRSRTENADDVRNELGRLLRDRALSKPNEPARKRIEVIEHALAAIDVPARGPLASVDLWALERQLAANDARGVEEKLDAIERARGKTPATRYLREHASFVRGSDPPRRIAERLSHWMRPGAPFYELDLLKARAWLAAGMPGYARHYARGLVEDRSAPDGVCLVALEILEVTSSRSRTMPPPPVQPATAGPTSVRSAPIVMLGPRVPSQPSRDEVVGRGSSPAREEVQRRGSAPAAEEVWRRSAPPPEEIVARGSVVPPSEAPPPIGGRPAAPSWPPQGEVVARVPRPGSAPPREEVRLARPGSSPARDELLARTMPLTRAIAQLPAVTQAIPRGARPAFLDSSEMAHAPETERMPDPPVQHPPPQPVPPRPPQLPPANPQQHIAGRGFVTDNPPPHQMPPPPQGSMPPRRGERYVPENAETLPLPPGLTEDMLAGGVIPRTPDEVRIACTRMSRELARDYRLWYGTRLQVSAIAIETMQRHLLTRWPDGVAEGDDSTFELRRHGALLSEILARALQGYWVDVKPTEVGYWAMFVAPSTRTWPFGRVVRFVTMGHREKDLVSYYLELASRARGQR